MAGLEEFILHDQLVAPKIKAMTAVYKLLVSKAELEQRLLRMLANKLGDPDNRVSSKCLSLLRNLGACMDVAT